MRSWGDARNWSRFALRCPGDPRLGCCVATGLLYGDAIGWLPGLLSSLVPVKQPEMLWPFRQARLPKGLPR